jgi:hypothetical protein
LKRELKQKIKEDEFKSGLEHAIEWVQAHAEQVRLGAAAVLVAAAVLGGVAYVRSQRTQEARRAFADALETFEAPVKGELPEGQAAAGIVFASAEEKYRKAAAAFDGLERKYGTRAEGLRGRYYAALCRIELGDHAEARKALTELAGRRDGLEPALARLALAELERRSGAVDKAVEAYRQLADDAALPLPRDQALMSLATILEDAQRNAEASAAYQRLADEYPESPYASEARQRARYLREPAQG